MNFLLLQINDTAFPIGSYTQSFGLETYVLHNIVKNQETAYMYIKSLLHSQLLYVDFLAIKLIYETQDLSKVLYLESLINVATPAQETRQGMQKIGTRFIKAVSSMSLPFNKAFHSYIELCKTPVHATAYGFFCVTHNIHFGEALSYYMYALASNILINCVKLIPLSQYDGQKILYNLHTEFEKVYAKLQILQEEDFCNASVHNDIKSMQHEALHSRLYMS